jgi:hypothetical protein
MTEFDTHFFDWSCSSTSQTKCLGGDCQKLNDICDGKIFAKLWKAYQQIKCQAARNKGSVRCIFDEPGPLGQIESKGVTNA